MARPTVIDVAGLPELRRIAEEVHESQEPIVLRSDGEELAVLMPIDASGRRGKRRLSQSDDDAVMSAAGSWQDLIDDVDKLKAELKAARGSNRLPVDL